MKQRGLKFLSLLLMLVIVLGLSATAYADSLVGTVVTKGDSFTLNNEWVEYFPYYTEQEPVSPTLTSISYDTTYNVWYFGFNGWGYGVAGPTTPTPIGFKFVSGDGQSEATAYRLALFYGYTVTYKPGDEATGTEQTVTVSKNEQGTYTHPIQKYEDSFTAPAGKRFDHWQGSDGKTYKYGDTATLTGDLTLTAQWKKSGSDGGDSEGGGSGLADLVFNIPGADDSWEYVGGGYAPQQAYRVSLAPMQGGSAALGLTTGDSGAALNVYPTSAVYVFPNAEQGYVLDKIVWSLIDGSASYDITEAKNFVMPAMDVVVYVTFKPIG